jgi:hypothetical protein
MRGATDEKKPVLWNRMAYNITNSVEWWLLHLIITRECLQSLNGDLDARVILEIFGRRHILRRYFPASAWRN